MRGLGRRALARLTCEVSHLDGCYTVTTGHDPYTDIHGIGDTMTTPTASMLAAIQSCTLRDDVFQEDDSTTDLEAYCASITGKEAGLFVLSGTMGNQLALRSHLTQPPHGVLCDHRSHIVLYEAGGVATLSGALLKTVVPANGDYLTLEDIKKNVILSEDVHSCPTRVISLENTLNGMVTPLDEVRRISEFARGHGIKMHLDGARLWEAVASGAGTLPEFCEPFDTISLCFSKGLGAPVGSVLVGEAPTLKHCRWTRKAIGGGTRQPGLLTAAAKVAVVETFGTTPDGSDGWLRRTHEMAKQVEAMWTSRGGGLVHPVQTNMVWADLDTVGGGGCTTERFVALGKEEGLSLFGGRMVLHYQVAQRAEEVLPKLERIFDKVFDGKRRRVEEDGEKKDGQASMYVTR